MRKTYLVTISTLVASAILIGCSSFPSGVESFDSINQALGTRDIVKVRGAIQSGLDVDEYDEKGYSPLMNALESGAGEDIVQLLLENGANPNFHENISQRTPLMVWRALDAQTTQRLLDAGADPNSQDKWRNNALYYYGQLVTSVNVIELLIAKGVDIRNRGLDGMTPFMIMAGRNQNLDVLATMLAQGIDINEADNNGWTALFYAARETKNLAVIDFLLAHGALPGMKDRLGYTAAHYADDFRKIPETLMEKLSRGEK